MKTDLVYVLGRGSRWKNRELRYSLRSVQQNLKGVGRIYVVGENPGFLSKEVIHIPVYERFDPKLNPSANVITKILAAINAGASDNFLLMNDDFIILQPINATEIPVLHKGKFSNYDQNSYFNRGNYRLRMRKTFNRLKNRGVDAYNFGVHVPFPIHGPTLKRMLNSADWKEGVGISYRTLYGNQCISKAQYVRLTSQKKTVYSHYTLAALKARFQGVTFMAFNDRGLNRELKKFLRTTFPEQSIYESSPDIVEPKPLVAHRRIA